MARSESWHPWPSWRSETLEGSKSSMPGGSLSTQVALLWQEILRSDPAAAFSGTVGSAIDRSHGHDRLPQPGFVGSGYKPKGVLILGQNPGNDAVGKGEAVADLHQYQILRCLRDAKDTESAESASHALMAALDTTVMPTWRIVQNVVMPLLKKLHLDLKDIAYLNLVKFRTVNSDFPSRIYDHSWFQTSMQIELLEPQVIIVLGVRTYKEFKLRYKGQVQHFRVQRSIGDTRLPDEGRKDIESIVAQLSWVSQRPPAGMNTAETPVAAAQPNCQEVPVRSVSGLRSGSYRILDPKAILNRVSKRHDPRWEFYDAMMKLNKYEDYYGRFGNMKVYPETYRSSPRTAHTEMAWAKKQGWVSDI